MGESVSNAEARPVDPVRRFEELCDRFEDELRGGRAPTVDQFLRAVDIAEAGAPGDLLRELNRLLAEYATAPANAPRDSNPLAPTALSGFEVRELIGRGGAADVYRAYDPVLNCERALNVVRTAGVSPADLARFRTEAATAAALDHPNITRSSGSTTAGSPHTW